MSLFNSTLISIRVRVFILALLSLFACNKPDYFAEALELYSEKRYAEANKLFRLVPNDNERIEKAYFYRGVCMTKLDSATKAITLLQKALDMSNHDRGLTLSYLGNAYNLNDEYIKAFHCYQNAALINPRLKYINSNAGMALLNANEYQTAIKYLRRDYEQTAYSHQTLLALSEAYSLANNPDSASFFQKLANQ